MRKNITFASKGLRCSGLLHLPEDLAGGQKAPAVIMACGFSAVKEGVVSDFAERFAAAGLASLAFDYRNFGDSEGEPHSQLFPLDEVEDVRNAISWISNQPEVDPQRIGLWGTSYGGGIVVYAAAFDKRVKAVVAQIPMLISPEFRRVSDPERWDRMGMFLLKDRIERYETGAVNYIKVVSQQDELCVLSGKEAYDGYMSHKQRAPNWQNQVTIESLEKTREFDPTSVVNLIAPAALLVIPGEKDNQLSIQSIKETYERAGRPKDMLTLPIKHFEVYGEPWFSKAAGAAINWFNKYL